MKKMPAARVVAALVAVCGTLIFADDAAAVPKSGADNAAPSVAALLATFPIQANRLYTFSAEEIEQLLTLAAEKRINLFELIDGSYRYLAPRRMRVSMPGDILRAAEPRWDFGRERIRSLIPLDVLIRIEAGAAIGSGQKAMDVYLTAKREEDLELGIALYDTRFGFGKLEPKLFSEAYGVKVKRFPLTLDLVRLELYEPAKGAIWVKGLGIPKRWKLYVVTKKQQGNS
jgi:hypothetical protein